MSITPEAQEPRQKLRRAAADLSHTAEDVARATKSQTTRAVETLQSGVNGLRERTHQYADRARNQLSVTQRKAIETVRERPAASTAAAFGLGLAAGFLLAVCTRR